MQHSGTKDLPIGKNEDVQYDPTKADADDREAQHRAKKLRLYFQFNLSIRNCFGDNVM